MSAEKGTITSDPELKAMTKIAKIIAELPDEQARARVMAYLENRYKVVKKSNETPQTLLDGAHV